MFINNLIYRAKYRYAKSLPLKVPVDVSLELASTCNQRCGYCYHADQTKLPFQKGIMSFDIAKKIITEAAELGVHSIKTNWKGESTMNPAFKQITDLAKNMADGSTFIDRLTNSNFKFDIKREDIFLGLCNQTKVKISFDSFIPGVMETQRFGSDRDKAIANIDKFYDHPERKKTVIVIQAVRTKLNKDEDLEGEVKKRWPEALISIRDMVGGRVDSDVSALENRVRDTSERQSCIQAHARVIFNWKGLAFPCCPDIEEKLQIGDINTQSLYSIFNSLPARWLREDLKSEKAFKYSPCASCSSFETYKGFKPSWNS